MIRPQEKREIMNIRGIFYVAGGIIAAVAAAAYIGKGNFDLIGSSEPNKPTSTFNMNAPMTGTLATASFVIIPKAP